MKALILTTVLAITSPILAEDILAGILCPEKYTYSANGHVEGQLQGIITIACCGTGTAEGGQDTLDSMLDPSEGYLRCEHFETSPGIPLFYQPPNNHGCLGNETIICPLQPRACCWSPQN